MNDMNDMNGMVSGLKAGIGILCLAGAFAVVGCGQRVDNPLGVTSPAEEGSGGFHAIAPPPGGPTTTITNPLNGQIVSGVALSAAGYSKSRAGFSNVQMKMRDFTTGLSWDGSMWQSSTMWFTPSNVFPALPNTARRVDWAELVMRPPLQVSAIGNLVMQARAIDLSGTVGPKETVSFLWR